MTLFDKIYEGAKETLKSMKKPLVERALKRRFDSFIDGCDARIDELELKKHELIMSLESPEKYDINAIVKIELDLEQTRKSKSIAEKYKWDIFNAE